MTNNPFKDFPDHMLLDAYEEYKALREGKPVSAGIYQDVAAQLEQACPGRGAALAAHDLLRVMADHWYLSLRPVGKILEVDDDVWLVQYGEVKEARVVRVLPDGEDYIYWIQPYDTEVEQEYPEKLLGSGFFLTELDANRYLDENG